MKNILTYKLFESNSVDDLIQEMKDILLPLSDMGLNVSIVKLKSQYFNISKWVDQPNWMDIALNINTLAKHYSDMNKEFILGDCYNDLIRLLHYMKSIGFDNNIRFNIKDKGSIRYRFDDDNNLIGEDGRIFNNEAIGIIKINFMKR